jgi:hypothetical protein
MSTLYSTKTMIGDAAAKAAIALPPSVGVMYRFLQTDGTVYDAVSDTWSRVYPAKSEPVYAGDIRPVVDAHTRVHMGTMFRAGVLVASVANDASINLIITTPEDDWPHIVFHPALDGSADFAVFESPTFTEGTPVTAYNLKRTSNNVWGGTVVHTPTISNDGTMLMQCHISGGTGPHAGGGSNGFDEEWVLKASTSYLIRLTNRTGNSKRGSLCPVWYSAPLIPDA